MLPRFTLLLIAVLSFLTIRSTAADTRVDSQEALKAALKAAQPGDSITVLNGTYRDLAILITADGTPEKPITLQAETTGQVSFEGQSFLRIGGDYVTVKGFAFRNGYAPKGGVIEFMVDEKNIANHSRVTECAIDHYSKPDRFKSDNWIIFQGRQNRIDHCYIAGKFNEGTTLIVELNLEAHRQNGHRIDHNVFGYRPRLGSNGGETIRIGVSAFCQYSSNTVVENNWFERCSGEVEIISVKSSDNVVRGNVFWESEGVVALRHGDRNLIEGNFFLGNGKPYTGGVRVVNESHLIRGNHFQDLTGPRFFGTLPIMNGVPNSLPNRYMPVKDVTIEGNYFFNTRSLVIGEGRDNERSAFPTNCRIIGNTFYSQDDTPPFVALDDFSTFSISDNRASVAGRAFESPGFSLLSEKVTKIDGLYQTEHYKPVLPIHRDECMPAGHTVLAEYTERIPVGKQTRVAPGKDTLAEAVAKSAPGDTLVLQAGEKYALTRPLAIKHPLSLRAEGGTAKATLFNPANTKTAPLVRLENGGSFTARGLRFDGYSDNGVAEAAIITDSEKPMIERFTVSVEDCDFVNFDSGGCSAFTMTKGAYADSVTFRNCRFESISGIALSLRSEIEDKGKYNAEFITIENCLFRNVMGSCIDIYRGGNDESTSGPFLTINQCTFINSTNVELGSTIRLIGVQVAKVQNCLFVDSGMSGRAIRLEDPRWCQIVISHSNFDHSGRVESFYDDRKGPALTTLKAEFVDAKNGDFRLKPGSPLLSAGNDGKAIGWLAAE